MKLLTRNQIIEIWKKHKKHKDKYVCPFCRDILSKDGEFLLCENTRCTFEKLIRIEEIKEMGGMADFF